MECRHPVGTSGSSCGRCSGSGGSLRRAAFARNLLTCLHLFITILAPCKKTIQQTRSLACLAEPRQASHTKPQAQCRLLLQRIRQHSQPRKITGGAYTGQDKSFFEKNRISRSLRCVTSRVLLGTTDQQTFGVFSIQKVKRGNWIGSSNTQLASPKPRAVCKHSIATLTVFATFLVEVWPLLLPTKCGETCVLLLCLLRSVTWL